MKKFFSMLVMVLLMISLAGCSKSMNYVIGNEPSFVGTVEVVTDEYVLVNVNDDDAIYSDHPNIQVSLLPLPIEYLSQVLKLAKLFSCLNLKMSNLYYLLKLTWNML